MLLWYTFLQINLEQKDKELPWLIYVSVNTFSIISSHTFCVFPSQNRSVFGLSDSWLGAAPATAAPCGGRAVVCGASR